MELEFVQSIELLLANFAPMRLFSRVHQAVGLQGGGLCEALLANFTFVRTFARVRSQMDLEVAQLTARLCAKVAPVMKLSVLPLQRVR